MGFVYGVTDEGRWWSGSCLVVIKIDADPPGSDRFEFLCFWPGKPCVILYTMILYIIVTIKGVDAGQITNI